MEPFALKGGYKKEKEFTADFYRECRKRGWHVYRIPDIGAGYRFYDADIWTNDAVYACEFKIIDGYSMNINALEDIQHETMQRLSEHHARRCLVIVWSKKTGKYVSVTYTELMVMANERGTVKLFDK